MANKGMRRTFWMLRAVVTTTIGEYKNFASQKNSWSGALCTYKHVITNKTPNPVIWRIRVHTREPYDTLRAYILRGTYKYYKCGKESRYIWKQFRKSRSTLSPSSTFYASSWYRIWLSAEKRTHLSLRRNNVARKILGTHEKCSPNRYFRVYDHVVHIASYKWVSKHEHVRESDKFNGQLRIWNANIRYR